MVRLVVPNGVVGTELAAGIAHVVQKAAGEILPDRQPEMGAHSPDRDPILGIVPMAHGKSSKHCEAPASFQRFEHGLEVPIHARQRKIVAGDVEQVDAACGNRRNRGFELCDHPRVERIDPVSAPSHPIAAPCRGIVERCGEEPLHDIYSRPPPAARAA